MILFKAYFIKIQNLQPIFYTFECLTLENILLSWLQPLNHPLRLYLAVGCLICLNLLYPFFQFAILELQSLRALTIVFLEVSLPILYRLISYQNQNIPLINQLHYHNSDFMLYLLANAAITLLFWLPYREDQWKSKLLSIYSFF